MFESQSSRALTQYSRAVYVKTRDVQMGKRLKEEERLEKMEGIVERCEEATPRQEL